jgi:hypothetical protein
MSAVLKFAQGGYRFVSGVFQYSAGAAAEPGYEIVRARFAKLVPMMEGFSRIEKYLAGLGRPVHAFCEMERRMTALGLTWSDSTATQVYTIHDIHHIMADEIVGRGAAGAGLTWQFCRPPVDVLDYEMDVRGVLTEIVLP